MPRVQCKSCGEIGYTAAPESLVCKCGGRFKVIPENRQRSKVELDEERFRLFDTSEFIK